MSEVNRRAFINGILSRTGIVVASSLFPVPFARDRGSQQASRTLRVGRAQEIKTLAAAAAAARDGDTVLVDPGEYRGDVAVWRQSELVIRPSSGKVVLLADDASAEGKGTFVFRQADAVVEDFVFKGARSRDRNGSGIRLDAGARLTVNRCSFQDNENGILTSNDAASELRLIDSEFIDNGGGDGLTHNIYVGAIDKLTVTGCYSARARVGHLLKSRARESLIAYSRLSGEDGTSSYELDFPSGGRAMVIGCLIQQGSKSENSTIISYGTEGYRWKENQLVVTFSTLVNDRRGGRFLHVAAGAERVLFLDNVLVGNAESDVSGARATKVRNMEANAEDFADARHFDYRLRFRSRLVGAAGLAGALGAERAPPRREYRHPAGHAELGAYIGASALSPGAFQRTAP